MKSLKSLAFVLLLLFAVALFAQINTLVSRPNLQKEYDLEAVFIPATPTTIIDQDIWLSGLTLTSNASTDVQCSIADLQSSPVPLFPSSALGAIPAGAVYSFTFSKTKMTGGIRWSCGTGGVIAARVSGYIR